MTTKGVLKSKSWRKQTSFRLNFLCKYNRGGSIFWFLWFLGRTQQALMFRFSPPHPRRWCQHSGRCAAASRLSQMPLGTLTSCDGGRLTKSSLNCFPTLPEWCQQQVRTCVFCCWQHGDAQKEPLGTAAGVSVSRSKYLIHCQGIIVSFCSK